MTYPNKDNRRSDSEQSVELNEVLVLLLVTATVHVELFDTLNGQLLMLQSNFVGIGGEFAGVAVDMGRESGREEDNLNGAGDNAVVERCEYRRSCMELGTYALARMHWSPRPCWSSMLSASSNTRTFNALGFITRFLIIS